MDVRRGRPLAVDRNAKSASATEPAFVAPPEGAPVYYGFVVLDDVVVDGFTLGKITDWEAEPCSEGDAFVIAPDGSRAGLFWGVCDTKYFRGVLAPEPQTWGVWAVGSANAQPSQRYRQPRIYFARIEVAVDGMEVKTGEVRAAEFAAV